MYLYKNKIVILIFLSFCFQSICNAELIKPKNSIKPLEVVEIQLNGLKNNNEPYEDFGIEQTWEFAHPNNKKYTGPLEKFKSMLKSDMYQMLINHLENKIDIISGRAEKTNLPNVFCDYLVCNSVLHGSGQTLKDVDFIILSPGVSLNESKNKKKLVNIKNDGNTEKGKIMP